MAGDTLRMAVDCAPAAGAELVATTTSAIIWPDTGSHDEYCDVTSRRSCPS